MPSSPKNHPPSPSPHPPPRVPIFLSARHRRRCSLQAPCRVVRPARLGRYVDALPVSTACCSQLPPVQLACLLFRPGQEEKLEASTHLHHFLLFHVSPSQLLYISSSHSHYVSFKISILDYGTLILYALMSKYSLTTKWT